MVAGEAVRLPFAGVRVVDLTHGLAGPFGTQLFAFLGADVIKVESHTRPDRFRTSATGGSPEALESSRGFAEANRNKRSLSLNLKTAEGRAVVRRLLAISDVLVENYSLGVLERWGLDYESVRRDAPHLIMVSMQGMGRRGPYKHWVTWGASLLAFTGVDWMWGYPDQDRPVGSQIAHPDYVAGVLAALGAAAALVRRRRSGAGQYVELPQVLGAASLLPATFLEYFVNGRLPARQGNQNPWYAPYGVYPCAGEDRWCAIAVTTEEEWRGLVRALGDPPWAADPRFADMPSRALHRDALDRHLAEWTRERTPHDVMETLQRHGAPAGAVQNGQDLFNDAHLRARGVLVEVEHPRMPTLTFPNTPVRLDGKPASRQRHAPLLGEHTVAVLQEVLGMERDEIAALDAAGALL